MKTKVNWGEGLERRRISRRIKLTAKIMLLRVGGLKQEAIARELGIGQATVSRVLDILRRWKWIKKGLESKHI